MSVIRALNHDLSPESSFLHEPPIPPAARPPPLTHAVTFGPVTLGDDGLKLVCLWWDGNQGALPVRQVPALRSAPNTKSTIQHPVRLAPFPTPNASLSCASKGIKVPSFLQSNNIIASHFPLPLTLALLSFLPPHLLVH